MGGGCGTVVSGGCPEASGACIGTGSVHGDGQTSSGGFSAWLSPSRRLPVSLLVLLLVIQLVLLVRTFDSREDFHIDECWSYGFANSYYDGYISRGAVEDSASLKEWNDTWATQNFGEWTSGETLQDYLTVQEGEAFDYASVLASQRYDIAPPLHSLILHTICSFFPNTFSWWYAFSINLVAFVGAQICLFLLARRLLHSPWLGLLVVAFFGFSPGALNGFTFLRPYALLTFLLLLYCCINVRLYDKGFRGCPGTYLALGVVTFLGAYTQVYFLFFAFVTTVGWCIHLAIKRDWKALLLYGCVTLAAVLVMCAACTHMFEAMRYQSSVYEEEHTVAWRIMYCLSILLGNSIGLSVPTDFGSTRILLLILLFMSVFVAMRSWQDGFSLRESLVRGLGGEGRMSSGNPAWCWLTILASTLVAFAIVATSIDVMYMGILSVRYFVFVMPYVCLMFVGLLWRFVACLVRKEGTRTLVTLLITAMLSVSAVSGSRYVFSFPDAADFDGTIDSLTTDADVVIDLPADWSLTYWASHLRGRTPSSHRSTAITPSARNSLQRLMPIGPSISFTMPTASPGKIRRRCSSTTVASHGRTSSPMSVPNTAQAR